MAVPPGVSEPLVELFDRLRRDPDALWPRLSRSLQRSLGSSAGLRAFARQASAMVEHARELMWSASFPRNGHDMSEALLGRPSGPPVYAHLALRRGTVGGLIVASRPPAGEPAGDPYVLERLPLDGSWWVMWGGRYPFVNQHHGNVDERFAVDLIRTRDGWSHPDEPAPDDGRPAHAYLAFGEPVRAPADGAVVDLRTTLPDHRPGVRDTHLTMGNFVRIDHGGGVSTLLCHLQRGSVPVEQGQRVRTGDLVGRCGNSGNSTEPHLHLDVQRREGGEVVSVPFAFDALVVDGRERRRVEPTRGTTVAPGG